MGIPFSLLSKLGVPGVNSLTTDQIYNKFFKVPEIKEFKDFHVAFIDLCKFFNDVMPGKHFVAPTREEIEEFYKKQWDKRSEAERKENLTNFVQANVKSMKTDDNAIIIAGLVAPAAAVVLKNAAENIPPVKRFKLHLVPNFVFVPACTLLALAGVQLMQISKKTKP